MVKSDQDYNSFQIIRPVLETTALKRFWQVADHVGSLIFRNGGENFELIEDEILSAIDSSFDNEGGQGNGSHSVGVAEHDMYNRNGLKLVLLDRRSPKGYKSQPLLRAFARFDRPTSTPIHSKGRQRASKQPLPPALPVDELHRASLRHDVPDPSQLQLQFSQIIPVNDPANRKGGVEFALAPDPKQAETLLVYEEAAIIFNAFQNLYHDLAFPATKTTHQVSFGRTPETASDEQIANFVTVLEKRLPVVLDLGAIQPKFNN